MDFLQLTQLRHSVRHYATRPVEPEKIDYILECARLAPSAVNKQPWRFILVRSEEARAKVQRCYPREWFAEAPLYIIICAVETEAWVRPCDSKNHADIDAAIATEHICLAAATGDWAVAGYAISTRACCRNFSRFLPVPIP